MSNDKENSLKLFTEIILEELGRFGIYNFMQSKTYNLAYEVYSEII